MATRDDPISPEWRPTSSLSGGLPSAAASSIGLQSSFYRLSDPSQGTSSSDYGGEYNSSGPIINPEMAIGRDIAPFEAVICEALVEEIRSLDSPGEKERLEPLYALPVFQSPSLEAAISRAAATVRYNAKWFTSDGLTNLMRISLQRVSRSSSAELYAALFLVDTVGTYTILPAGSLDTVVHFIAQAYYNASRARQTKRIAAFAWTALLHILRSHLGPQVVDALFDAMEGDLQTKEGFAATAGALMLVLERLQSREDDLPPVNLTVLVLRLRAVATASNDDVIAEHIFALLAEVLSRDAYLDQIEQDAGLGDIFAIVSQHEVSVGLAKNLLGRLAPRLPHMEPLLVSSMAWLHLQMDQPLTETLSREVIVRHCSLLPTTFNWASSFEVLMQMLCANTLYLEELQTLVQRNLFTYHLDGVQTHTALPIMVKSYVDHIIEPTTAPEAKGILSKALITMFMHSVSSDGTEDEVQLLFDALCTASGRQKEVAEFLFRIRADVTGAIYVIPAEDTEATAAKGTTSVSTAPSLDKWQVAILGVLQHSSSSWDVLDVFLRETKYLLSNHTLFTGDIQFIKNVQSAVRQSLDHGSFMEPPPYTGLTKSHIAGHLIQTLTASMSYHRLLPRDDVVSLVGVFNNTAGSRDYVVSTQCIHALTICCYEVPDVMSRFMDDVIDKMSRLVTQRYLAIHVLQFLAGLSRLPELYRNFTQNDYKKIFAVCNSYLQSTRGVQTVLERKQTPTSERSSLARSEEALPEYVYALAHHTITFWYMSLVRQDRQGLKPYITSCLTYEKDGKPYIEDQGLVTIDMMDKVDADAESGNLQVGDPFTRHDGRLVERHRLVGMLLVTTRTALRTNKTLVTVRRPSGTAQRLLETGRTRVTVETDDDEYLTVLPDDVLGRTYGAVSIPKPSSALGSLDILTLPDEDAVHRAIASLDRTSALDSHKAGVIYVGEKQSTEDRIFLNISGSPDFREFVRDLGNLRALKGATFNTQGLDRADNMDGEHAIVWHNEVTEVVFHVTTMMPNSSDPGENTARKKRHVGNDHVNIVFNNSGSTMSFTDLYNIFPGQFTYVYIVITPSARTSFVEARTENTTRDKKDRFYRVQVVTRPDYPNTSSAAEEKVVSGASLPGMVRNLALTECIMSLMWTQRNDSAEYPSSWRSRMHQLRRLGDRYRAKYA